MAAIEDRVLTKLLMLGSLSPAFQRGLTPDHFMDRDRADIFRFMVNFWNNPATSRTLPTIGRIRKRWPSFMPTATDDDDGKELNMLISDLKMSALTADTLSLAEYFRELVEVDPYGAVSSMKTALHELDVRMADKQSKPMGLKEIARLAREQYAGAKSGAIYGVPWPWRCLTNDTLGKRPGDFIVFYGRMKSMKTWIMLYCAACDYMVNRRRVLVWSREMSQEKLGLRMASLLAEVDYYLFKAGCLPPALEEKAFAILNDLASLKSKQQLARDIALNVPDLLLLAGRGAPRTLELLDEHVKDFQPDVIYLDSFYHIDSQRSGGITERWKRVAALAEDVKSWAEDLMLPVVAVHQANRLGEKTYGNTLADMADADVIAREADLIMRVVVDPSTLELHEEEYEQELSKLILRARDYQKGPRFRPRIKLPKDDPRRELTGEELQKLKERIESRKGAQLALVPGGNREGILPGFIIRAIPGYDFRVVDENPKMSDIKKWVKEDDKREDGPTRPTPKGKVDAQDFAEMLSNTKGETYGAGNSRPDS